MYALCKASVRMLRCPTVVWEILKDMFSSVSEAEIDSSRSQLQSIKFMKVENVLEYGNRLTDLVNQLDCARHTVSKI